MQAYPRTARLAAALHLPAAHWAAGGGAVTLYPARLGRRLSIWRVPRAPRAQALRAVPTNRLVRGSIAHIDFRGAELQGRPLDGPFHAAV